MDNETRNQNHSELPRPNLVVEPFYKNSLYLWPPLVLLFVLALFLVWILLPGVLNYPVKNTEVSVWKNDSVNDRVTESLKIRISDLKTELSREECVPEDKSLLMPDPKDLLPSPNLKRPQQNSGNLVNFIKEATVFVWNEPINQQPSFGSGFFVTPTHIVTNQHVVENLQEGDKLQAFLSGELEPFEVKLIKKSEPTTNSKKDFALLEAITPANRYYPIFLPSESLQLQLENVIAAGFPGDAFEVVGASGENSELSVFITSGVINTEQKFENGGGAFVHSATISLGNSGGPLIDACGRVLGVNTMVYSTDIRTLNIALNSRSLLEFLKRTGVEPITVTEACNPQIIKDPENAREN